MESLSSAFKDYVSSLHDLPGLQDVNTKLRETKTGKTALRILKKYGETLKNSSEEMHGQIGAELIERVASEERLRKLQKKAQKELFFQEKKPPTEPKPEEIETRKRKFEGEPGEAPPSKKKKEEPKQKLSQEEAAQAFWAGKERDVAEFVKGEKQERVFKTPVFGPMQISPQTIKAQEMFDELFSNYHDAQVSIENDSLIIKIKDKTYNLSQILPYVEFDHISVSKQATDSYRKLLEREFIYKPACEKLNFGLSSDADYEKFFKDRGYKEPADPAMCLSLAEKFAINIFTGYCYKLINPLMRNQIDRFQKNLASRSFDSCVKEALAHLVIAMSGLKKLPPYSPPDMKTKYLWRVEFENSDFPLEERIRAVLEGGSATYHLGFLSSSHTKPEPYVDASGQKVVAGALIKSPNGKDISFFSQQQVEREILSAPSLIRWTHVEHIKHKGEDVPVFIGYLFSSPQEYALMYNFDRMFDYFLILDQHDVEEEVAKLPPNTRAALCAFLIQEKSVALHYMVDDFFQSKNCQNDFTSVDTRTQKILISYAQEKRLPIVNDLVRLNAECLATSIQASQMIQDQILSTSAYDTITALKEHFRAHPETLKQYYESPDIQKKILDLKKECESRFTRNTLDFSGQDSLNRELITSTLWNDALRDKDVILALFALEADPSAASLELQLNSLSYAKNRKITSMIEQGVLAQHPVVLETLPLNGTVYATSDLAHIREYSKRKAIDQTFIPIFNAIDQAYTKATEKDPPQISQKSLFDVPYSPSGWHAYLNIFNTLERAIHSVDEATLYASEANATPKELKEQVLYGFNAFCTAAGIDLKSTTLPELVEKMAKSDALLDQKVSHLMYDRLHLLVALGSPDLTIQLADNKIVSIEEVFRNLVDFFATPKLPNSYALAAEQFYTRIIFLAEKLTLSFPEHISHEELMKYKQESGLQAMSRANEIQRVRAEEMRKTLGQFVSHPEIRKSLVDDFGIELPALQQIETADPAALESYKKDIKKVLLGFYDILSSSQGNETRFLGPTSIEDMISKPELALNFLKFVRGFHLNQMRDFIGLPRKPGWWLRTREEYEQAAQEVETRLNDPDWVQSPHEVHFFLHSPEYKPYAGYAFAGFFKLLQKLPNITGIYVDIDPLYCSKALKDFKKFGLSDKILTLDIYTQGGLSAVDYEKWTIPQELWELTNLQNLSLRGPPPVIEEIPDDISSLQKLTDLLVKGGWHQKVRISEGVWRLPQLVTLNLDCDAITAIPEQIASHETLHNLTLESSTLKKFPEGLWRLKNLIDHSINLAGCSFPFDFTRLSEVAETEDIALSRFSFLEGICSSARGEVRDEFYCQTGEKLPSQETILKLRQDRELAKRENDPEKIVQIDNEIAKTLKLLKDTADRISHALPSYILQFYGHFFPQFAVQMPGDILKIFSASHSYNLALVGEALGMYTLKNTLNSKADLLQVQNNVIKRLSEGVPLTELNVEFKGITAIPLEVLRQPHLKVLSLASNSISYVPAEIGDLKELRELDLKSNAFSSLPEELGNLTMLKFLNLAHNHQINQLPQGLSKLENLERLNVCDDQLLFFPEQVEKLKKLKHLSVFGNPFLVFPEQILKLTSLDTCEASLRQLRDWPQAEGKSAGDTINLNRENTSLSLIGMGLKPVKVWIVTNE